MSHRTALNKLVRVGLISVILATTLLVAPVASVSAGVSSLQATIRSITGAVMGTATFTPGTYGGVRVEISVSGFNPVGGDRRLTIRTNYGAELWVLPPVQFYPNGSANYATVTTLFSLDQLAQTAGATVVLQADSYQASEVIGWGTITGVSWPGYGWQPYPGGYWPQPQPLPQPPCPVPPPQPQPSDPIVGRLRVIASDGLRLRSGPGLGYSIRRVVGLGTILESTGIEQWGSGLRWVKVRYGGVYYWASRDWLQAY